MYAMFRVLGAALGVWLICFTVMALHELGHLAVTKIAGVPVVRVVLGSGPLLTQSMAGETLYEIRLIPFDGGVAAYSPTPEALNRIAQNAELRERYPELHRRLSDPARTLTAQPRIVQALIAAAGPAMNLVVLWFCVVLRRKAQRSRDDSAFVAAAAPRWASVHIAGAREGDLVTTWNGRPFTSWWQWVYSAVYRGDSRCRLGILRGNVFVEIESVLGPDPSRFGLRRIAGGRPMTWKEAFTGSFRDTWRFFVELAMVPAMLMLTAVGPLDRATAKATALPFFRRILSCLHGISWRWREESSRSSSLLFAAALSLFSGIANLLPFSVDDIPSDGARVLGLLFDVSAGPVIETIVAAAVTLLFLASGVWSLQGRHGWKLWGR